MASLPAYVCCYRHPYAEAAFPQLEAELSKRLGVTVSRSGRSEAKPRLLLYVALPIGVRLDASLAEDRLGLEREGKVRTVLVILRYGDTVHLVPASLPKELQPHVVQLAYTDRGLSELAMTREGLETLKSMLRKGD